MRPSMNEMRLAIFCLCVSFGARATGSDRCSTTGKGALVGAEREAALGFFDGLFEYTCKHASEIARNMYFAAK